MCSTDLEITYPLVHETMHCGRVLHAATEGRYEICDVVT